MAMAMVIASAMVVVRVTALAMATSMDQTKVQDAAQAMNLDFASEPATVMVMDTAMVTVMAMATSAFNVNTTKELFDFLQGNNNGI